jgi:hypothetical protein
MLRAAFAAFVAFGVVARGGRPRSLNRPILTSSPRAPMRRNSPIQNTYTQPPWSTSTRTSCLGRPTSQTNPSYNTGDSSYVLERQTAVCYAGNCAPSPTRRPEICASAYLGSFRKIGVGDTFYIWKLGIDGSPAGNTPDATKARTHAVVSVAPGTGATDCAVGTWILTVSPWIDYAAEGVANGMSLSPVWRDSVHPTTGAAYLMGYKLGSDSRDVWGAQGHNLILNPGLRGDVNGIVEGWTVTAGGLTSYPYDVGNGGTAPTAGAPCNSGDGLGYPSGSPGQDCVSLSEGGTQGLGTGIAQAQPVPVSAGESYIVSGLISTVSGSAYYGLADDRDGNGEWTVSNDLKVTLTDAQIKTQMYQVPRWFRSVMTIPAGVSGVKFAYSASSSSDWLDFVSMRKQTGLNDSTVAPNYLMNDPGGRTIVFMGDSWFETGRFTPYAPYFKQGLIDAFAARGIAIPPGQVIFKGTGGDTTGNILQRLPGCAGDAPARSTSFSTAASTTVSRPRRGRHDGQPERNRASLRPGRSDPDLRVASAGGAAQRITGVRGRLDVREAAHASGRLADLCVRPGERLVRDARVRFSSRRAARGRARARPLRASMAWRRRASRARPQAEVCNGLDDDCNGVIDDGGDALCGDADVCTDDVCGGTSGCSHALNAGTLRRRQCLHDGGPLRRRHVPCGSRPRV